MVATWVGGPTFAVGFLLGWVSFLTPRPLVCYTEPDFKDLGLQN